METRQIRYFLSACDSLNYSRAAESCGVALTTLTRSIKVLEKEAGGALFFRERNVIRLTDLGRLMQQHLLAAQQSIIAAQQAAERHGRLFDRLTVGVQKMMPTGPLITYLRNLHEVGSELEFVIREMHSAELTKALTDNDIDLALMSQPEYGPSFQSQPLLTEAYGVAFPPGHRFEAMEVVPLRELDSEPYVKRLHCEFPDSFANLGIAVPQDALSVRYVAGREDWVQAMVRAGLGVSLMTTHLPILPDLLTRPLVEPAVCRTISLVTVAGRPHSRPVQLAVDVAENTAWTSC